MAIWASGTPEHFLIHLHGVVHVIKYMGLLTKFKEQYGTVESAKLDWEIGKDAFSKSKKESKAKKDDNSSLAVAAAKVILDKAEKA